MPSYLKNDLHFRKGRSYSDNVTIMCQSNEKRKECNLETHIAFTDYEKAFDQVNRDILWQILEHIM